MSTIHKFEAAGLGKAPFQFIGLQTANDRAAINRERESNGIMFTTNYATSCDFCGTGIQNAYHLRSTDGKEFKVGCECIKKSGDAGLVKVVKQQEVADRQAKREAAWKALVAKTNNAIDAFRAGKCEALKSLPHPRGRANCTAYDYVSWCLENRCYGREVLKMIEDSIS